MAAPKVGLPDLLLRNALAANPVDAPTVAWVHENLLEEIAELKREKRHLLQQNKKLGKEKEGLEEAVEGWKKKAEGPAHVVAELEWTKEEMWSARHRAEIVEQAREIALMENAGLEQQDRAWRDENAAFRDENALLDDINEALVGESEALRGENGRLREENVGLREELKVAQRVKVVLVQVVLKLGGRLSGSGGRTAEAEGWVVVGSG